MTDPIIYTYDGDVEFEGRTLGVYFEARATHIVQGGIGSYEFWGAKCIDSGSPEIDEFVIIISN